MEQNVTNAIDIVQHMSQPLRYAKIDNVTVQAKLEVNCATTDIAGPSFNGRRHLVRNPSNMKSVFVSSKMQLLHM